jgi:hypothetical protein
VGLFRKRGPGHELVAAQAEIVAMGPTPKGARQTGKLDVEYEFTLELDGRRLTHTTVVPHDRMPLLGDTIPVRVAQRGEIEEIDFAGMPSLADRARASAAAAQAGDQDAAARALGFTPRPPGSS